MKFDFKPSENIVGFREYLNYLRKLSPFIGIYTKTMLPFYAVFLFSIITSALSKYYKVFTYMMIIMIGISIVYLFIFWLIIKVIKARKNKVIKNNKLYCDIESTFYFSIEDGYLIRENEFSNIKIQLSKIKYVSLLKHGLTVSTESGSSLIFIPNEILPVTLEEFIGLLKEENNSLIVIEAFKIFKKLSKNIYKILWITFILACIFSFFIGKYNYEHDFTKYNLIMQSDLIKQDNNKYLYKNEHLGISLTFPSKWEGKFGIEEMEDRINVYYLADGKQSNNTTLLFSIIGLREPFEISDFNTIKTEGLYRFIGPATIGLERGSEESLEYMKLYRDIKNVKLLNIQNY